MRCPTATRLRHNRLMPRESQQFRYSASRAGRVGGGAAGPGFFALDCVNPVNFAPWWAVSRPGQGGANRVPQTQMRAGIAAGPHCRRCWHSGIPAPELTASFRRSLPFGSHPSGRYSSSPLGRLVLPAGQALPSCSAFSPAASAVPDHMGLAVAGARAAFAALPRLLPLRACFLVSSFRRRSLRSGLATSPSDVLPRGRQGPFRTGLACCPSLRFRWSVPPVLRPSALPLPLCVGTPFRHPEPVFSACNPPFPKRASARWNWFQCILSSPVRLVNFSLLLSALRLFSQASFPSRQDGCCASEVSRTSSKMQSYPQAAQLLVDNSASCGICFVLVL